MDDERKESRDVSTATQHADPAWGVDRKEDDRPGIPKETFPEPLSLAHPAELIHQQSDEPKPFIGPNRFLTPVYSTSLPPRGLSGLMRRAAYRFPEYKARRWMMLLAADRIDALEHANFGKAAVGAGLILLGFSAMRVLRR